jgi:hypothetical protein
MKEFKPQSTTGSSVRRHLLVTAFSITVALLLSYETAVAQSAGPQTAKLIGTIKSDGFIGAVLSDAKGEQVFYRLKEKLPDGSQIVAVRSDSISLKGADGTPYEIYIAHDMPHETNAVASVRPERPADPYAPGAIRNMGAEQPNLHVQRRGRAGRQRSEAK